MLLIYLLNAVEVVFYRIVECRKELRCKVCYQFNKKIYMVFMFYFPTECQLNPTPGRCLIEEENTFWMYNTKLGVCVRITGCYDFHDRNVWSSEDRCRSKCNTGEYGVILPEIQPGIRIDPGKHYYI